MIKKIIGFSLILLGFNIQTFAKPIRVGWQIPWAVQGQLVQILKNTDILKNEKIEVEFIGRTFGPELNELAVAGEVDVILTADQPAATLFAKNDNWVGVSRLMYNRTATYVPLSSDIKSLNDLKNKTIGVPFGAAAQRIINEELKQTGLNPDKDVKFINLGIQEHLPLVNKSKNSDRTWDQFDALSGFDPIPAVLESKKMAKVIHVGKVCSLIVMNKDFISKNKTQAQKLVKAFEKAYEYYKKNPEKANEWFVKEAKLTDVTSDSLRLAASLEPNLNSNKISLSLSEDDYKIMEQAALFIEKSVNKKVNMKERVSEKYLK